MIFKQPKILLISLVLLFSCEKEEVSNESYTGELPVERFESEFSNYEVNEQIIVTSHSSCAYSKIYQKHHYKFETYLESAGRYFYKVFKQSDYDYIEGAYSVDWTEAGKLYRYDYENKLALSYSDIADASPMVLVDFNLGVGDSFLVNELDYFKIVEAYDLVIDGQLYPAYRGYVDLAIDIPSNNGNNPATMGTAIISPFNPSPFSMDNYFECYGHDSWLEENFGASLYSFGPTHVDGLSYFTEYVVDGTKFSRYYMTIDW